MVSTVTGQHSWMAPEAILFPLFYSLILSKLPSGRFFGGVGRGGKVGSERLKQICFIG